MRTVISDLGSSNLRIPVLVVAMAACSAGVLAGQLVWTELPGMPVGKWETMTAPLDGKLYLFAGYTEGVKSTRRADVFDPSDGTWSRVRDTPSGITHANAVLDGRAIWFAGGFKDGYKGHAIAEVWTYDLGRDRYTAAPLLPEPRAGGGLALVVRKLHYVGGLKADRDTDSGDHWVLDLDRWAAGSAVWQEAAPLPVPRNQFSTVAIGKRIYVVGGQFHHDSEQLDQARVDIYDTATDTWSRGPDLPKGHSHAEAGTFVHDGQIYMVGGHTTPEGGTKSVDPDILRLKPGGSWELLGQLPMPLSSPAAAVLGDKLYVAGGSPDGRSVQGRMWVAALP